MLANLCGVHAARCRICADRDLCLMRDLLELESTWGAHGEQTALPSHILYVTYTICSTSVLKGDMADFYSMGAWGMVSHEP